MNQETFRFFQFTAWMLRWGETSINLRRQISSTEAFSGLMLLFSRSLRKILIRIHLNTVRQHSCIAVPILQTAARWRVYLCTIRSSDYFKWSSTEHILDFFGNGRQWSSYNVQNATHFCGLTNWNGTLSTNLILSFVIWIQYHILGLRLNLYGTYHSRRCVGPASKKLRSVCEPTYNCISTW